MSGFLFVTLLLLVQNNCAQECGCNKLPSIEIVNDARLANDMREVRDEFLAQQSSNQFNRLSATILVRVKGQQTWKRGSINGTNIDYPASTVKLMYMYAAMEWCKKQGKSIDCLDRYVRPMVIVSSNLATGYVVDAITNTTNLDDLSSVDDMRWSKWLDRRLFTERLLQEIGMYENQIVRTKTYPTNSGQGLRGSEAVLWRISGQNKLQSCCTASFMLFLMQTRPKNERQYMKSMLDRTLENDQTTFGNGLPAGSILISKSGNAYDTVEEIAYIILPTGQEIILSAFSNGFQRSANDFYILGRFAEMVINKLALNSSATTIHTADDIDDYTCTDDAIRHDSSLPKDIIGKSIVTFNRSCRIHPMLHYHGVYSVAVWSPSLFNQTSNSSARLRVTVTDAFNTTDVEDAVIYDQEFVRSRWIPVGEFVLGAGRQNVLLETLTGSSVFNAIRFSMHPPLTVDPDTDTTSRCSAIIQCKLLYLLVILPFFTKI